MDSNRKYENKKVDDKTKGDYQKIRSHYILKEIFVLIKKGKMLETIKYNPESLNGDEKSLLMVNKINNNVVPSSTGVSRTRSNIIKK